MMRWIWTRVQEQICPQPQRSSTMPQHDEIIIDKMDLITWVPPSSDR